MSEDRLWARKQILESFEFKTVALEAVEILDQYAPGPYALIGGLAVAYYANPPVTVDMDFLVTGDRHQLRELAGKFEKLASSYWNVTRLLVSSGRPGRIGFGYIVNRSRPVSSRIDLLGTGQDKYLISVARNARRVKIQEGLDLRMINAEDLVIMKILAHRTKDIQDALLIREKLRGKLDEEYMEKKLDELEP